MKKVKDSSITLKTWKTQKAGKIAPNAASFLKEGHNLALY